jgi:hypothetical protein
MDIVGMTDNIQIVVTRATTTTIPIDTTTCSNAFTNIVLSFVFYYIISMVTIIFLVSKLRTWKKKIGANYEKHN